MNLAAGEIERIVREVLSRLDAAAPRDAAGRSTNQPKQADGSPATVTLAQRLVTQADLESLSHAKTIRVPAKAVITPAAKDYLRQRGVTLLRGGSEVQRATGGVRLVLGMAECTGPADELARLLANQGIAVERLGNGTLRSVLRQLSDVVSGGASVGVLLTGQVAAAVCLANRKSAVRAAAAASVEEVEAAIRQMGVNLLVVGSQGRSAYQLKQIVSRFCTGAPHACPDGYDHG